MAFNYEEDFQADQWYPKADSLYTEEMFGVGGEIDPMFPDTQMFDLTTGDYSSEYLDAMKGAGINLKYDVLAGNKSPRASHYSDLQDEAILGSWSGDQSYLAFPGERLLSNIEQSYGDAPRFSESGEMISPYQFHEIISGETSNITDVFDQRAQQDEMIGTIPGFSTDVPQGYIPFQGSN